MRSRPWPIVILALLHLIAPIINFVYAALVMHRPLYLYFLLLFGDGRWHQNLPHFVGFPLAGIAIYKTNKWSYPVFLAVMTWMLYSNLQSWMEYPEYFGAASFLVSFAVNIGLVTYFLLPEVREVYFNPRLRWWESKPRYDVAMPVKLRSLEIERDGVIQNISEGGVFIESDMILFASCEIDLRFEAFGNAYSVKAAVAHARRAQPVGYGIQFVHTPESLGAIKNLIKEVKAAGAQERLGNAHPWQEFLSWFKTAVTTGEGLVPVTRRLSGSRAPQAAFASSLTPARRDRPSSSRD